MPRIRCNQPCETEYYLVKSGSSKVTTTELVEGDEGGCLPQMPRSYSRALQEIAREAERRKNRKSRAIGGDCAQGCPCDTKKTSDIFRNKVWVPEKWKGRKTISYNGHRCTYLIKGTYEVKTARVRGLCNAPDTEDDLGEFVSYHEYDEDPLLSEQV